MPVRDSALARRLDALRRSGPPSVAPLWIEVLEPEAGLAAARGLEHPLARLQETRFLTLLGRGDVAETVAAGSTGPPLGFGPLFTASGAGSGGVQPGEECGGGAGDRFPPGAGELATRTLGELYLAQGDRERAVAIFRVVLEREPGDEAARARLGELTGVSTPGGGGTDPLAAWLGAVQDWRKTLGV